MNESAEPLISVCIANYNGADCIEECIASVLAGTGRLLAHREKHQLYCNADMLDSNVVRQIEVNR